MNMRRRMPRSLIGCLATILLTGCVTPESLVAPLPGLTRAVQAVVLYSDRGAGVADSNLFQLATEDRPDLRDTFRRVPVRIRHDGRNVVILVCSPDGKTAWLEDASWTMYVDKKWYEAKPPRPAEFSLDPSMAPTNNIR